MKNAIALLTIALMAGCASEEPAAPSSATHYQGMNVIVGDGATVIENAGMVVDSGKIVALGPADSVEAPAGASHVDWTGRTIMPLLHSLHVHVGYLVGDGMAAENYTRQSIMADLDRHAHYGVGAVLVLGSDVGDTAFAIREDQRQGHAGGAKLYTVGRGVTSVGGWPTIIPAIAAAPQQVETEEQAREAVRSLAGQKVDAVKVWVDDAGGRVPKIAPELYGAAIDEANRHGLKVYAHVYYLDDAKGLVEAGVSFLAHSIRDQEVDDELIAMMQERGVGYVPTLVAHEASIAYADQSDWIGESAMRETVDAVLIETLTSEAFVENAGANPGLAAMREQYETALVNVKKLHDAGITIGLGTDSGTTNRFPGYFEHREIELLVDAGLTPHQAIAAVTRNSAEALGLDGTLHVGAPAGFVLLRSDPLSDVRNTRDIEAVYFDGEKIDRAASGASD